MIGSISKIRPCGHHHYYKYAHAVTCYGENTSTSNDLAQIDREYCKDVDDNNYWNFSLNNATRIEGYCFQKGRFVGFVAPTPNLKYANSMFTGDNNVASPAVKEIQIDYDKIERCYALFYSFRLTDLPENFNPKTRNFDHLLTSGSAQSIADAHNGVFPFYPVLNEATGTSRMFIRNKLYMDENYTFENTTNASGMFGFGTRNSTLLECPKNLSFKNVTDLSNFVFLGSQPGAVTFTWFQTKDTMEKLTTANSAFYNQTYLSDLYPDYESFSLPALSTASNMFYGCILNATSIKKLSDALPVWESGSHPITIGCHIDHKYDPEVNIALKKLSSDYITPIEELGFTLPEEITSFKGWTLTVQWNGTATENAYPQPTE